MGAKLTSSTPMNEALKEFAKTYGPFGFGLFTLIIIWQMIITPILERSRLDFDKQRELMVTQNASLDRQEKLLVDLNRLGETTKETASTLQQTVTKFIEAQGQSEKNHVVTPAP